MSEQERLEAYAEWNMLTRHQIITAHLLLIEGTKDARRELAEAFDIESYAGWSDLIAQVKAKRYVREE